MSRTKTRVCRDAVAPKVSVRLHPATVVELRSLAERNRISLSDLVRRLTVRGYKAMVEDAQKVVR